MSRELDPGRFAETERALRDWLAAEAQVEPPASLAEALPRAAARPRHAPGSLFHAAPRGRLTALRGLAAAAAVGVIVLGALAISSGGRGAASSGSAGTTSASAVTTTPPRATALPAGPVALGQQEILDAGRDSFQIAGLVASGEHETLVTTYFGPDATKPDGTTVCGSSEISTWDAAGAVQRAAYAGGRIVAVAALADGTLAALANLGCDGMRSLLRSSDGGLTWQSRTLDGPSWPRGTWLGADPSDAKALAAWERSGSGGTLSWTADAGATWKSHGEARRPLAWDAGGLWFLRGELVERSSGPGGPTIEAGTAHGAAPTPPGDTGVPFHDSLVYRDAAGVSLLDGRTNSTRRVLDLDVVRFAATDGYVAAVGLDGHGGLVAAVSSDGAAWRTAALEKQQATSAADVAVVATPERLYVTATVTSTVNVLPAGSVAPPPSERPIPTPRSTPGGATLDWTRVTYPPAGGGTPLDLAMPVIAARHGGGFISAQWTRDGIVVRSSPDGRTWTGAATLHGSDMAVDGLIWSGREYVLLETAAQPSWPATSPPGTDTTPYVFTSPDGSHWTRHRATAPDAPSYATGLAESGGHLVLPGWSRSESTLWSSADGLSWFATPDFAAGRRASAVASGEGGFVVIGWEPGANAASGVVNGAAAVWISRDGFGWTRALVQQPPDGTNPSIEAVARGPNGYLALGTRFMGQVGPGSEVAWGGVWTSTDGSSWAFRDAPSLDGLSFRGAVWASGQFIAVAAGPDGTQFLLTSADGVAWTMARIPVPPPMIAATVTGPGIVSDGTHVLLDIGGTYYVR